MPSFAEIKEAAVRIDSYVHHTPVYTSTTLNSICQAELFFKAENMQKVGAFKARGAVNAVFSLNEKEVRQGVATHSSGNHAAALAYAARCRGIKAFVVMPDNAPAVKKTAVAGYGAEITYCAPTQKAREEALDQLIKRTGAIFIHPYDNHAVIAGQGTAVLELLEQVPDLDTVIAPVGGGGLLSGTGLAISGLKPDLTVIGAEPLEADDAFRSLQAGKIIPVEKPDTIADGLRTSLGELTFPIIKKHVAAILTATEPAIIEAMRMIWERMKIIVEPSAAVTLAVLLAKRTEIKGSKMGLILSGGNADLDNLPWLK
ncbi:MAG: pyridoxal-phosphate dependent enzyme [Bacillota bacterium]|nr:pyridoxal-phosphate dependent enzyme [Bacillota bacterium]MDW7728977.1 pyridoxal-phosphate dependent enzyme [Bacillota bacterium]